MDGAPHDADRSDLMLMLPFYENGTLPTESRAAVQAALTRDPALRNELLLVRECRDLARRGGAAFTPSGTTTTRRLWSLLGRL